jgi:hypothetical protein
MPALRHARQVLLESSQLAVSSGWEEPSPGRSGRQADLARSNSRPGNTSTSGTPCPRSDAIGVLIGQAGAPRHHDTNDRREPWRQPRTDTDTNTWPGPVRPCPGHRCPFVLSRALPGENR